MKSRISLLNICISTVTGICIAAICQRINNFFFYNVFIGSISAGVMSVIFFLLTKTKFKPEKSTCIYLTTISVLISYSFLFTIPLTVDRSYSVWMLKEVAQANASGLGKEKKNLLEESSVFFDESNGQLSRRVDEQVRIGNIKIVNLEEIEITTKGKLWAIFNKYVGIIFGLEPRYSLIE